MINQMGQIKTPNNRILTGTKSRGGYLTYNVAKKDGHKSSLLAHVAVAKQFIPNPNNLPIINHLDENKMNPCVNNLEWCTHVKNSNHGSAQDKRIESKKIPINEYSNDGKYIRTWASADDFGKYCIDFNVFDNNTEIKSISRSITNGCKGSIKFPFGKLWRYYQGNTLNLQSSDIPTKSTTFKGTYTFDVDLVPEKYLYLFHSKNELINYFMSHDNLSNHDKTLLLELITTCEKEQEYDTIIA